MLAIDYRPHTFAELSGQISARMILQSFVSSQNCPPAFLFAGPSGTGKTSTARIFAAALNCEYQQNGDCCGVCDSCKSIQIGNSSAVIEIDAASQGGVDSIRALKDLAQYSSSYPWRIILLDEAHAMSSQAFNALLKVLEEPPSNTVFVLLTTEPHKILSTVSSRAMPIAFQLVSTTLIVERLHAIAVKESIDILNGAIQKIAEYAAGSMRDAIMLLDQANVTGMLEREGIDLLTNHSSVPTTLCEYLLTKPIGECRKLLTQYFDESSDLAQLVSGLIHAVQDKYELKVINDIQLMTALKLLWDARAIKSLNKDSRAQIDAMVTLLHGVLQPHKEIVQKTILTVEELPTPVVDETIESMEELFSLLKEN